MLLFSVIVGTVLAMAAAEVKVGDIATRAHGVRGEVVAISENKIKIKNFYYDGTGPDAFFWVGTTGTPKSTDESKTIILTEDGKNYAYRDSKAPVLGAFNGKDVMLTLPENIKASDIAWLSVWCRQFSVDFGSLSFPADLKVPGSSSGTELPPPRVPPSTSAEPEPESEAEPYPEGEPEPESESEPEAEPKGSKAASVVLPSALGLVLAALLSRVAW